MLNIIKSNKTNIFLIGIFIAYLVLCFFVGSFHEQWADEAQAWLLARDCSVGDLIFNELKYDGHPFLWYLILKVVQIFHFPFDKLNILSLFFSSIGVYILLFKTKLPMFFKTTIPFCYWIFYQYSVIARNHSLIFPLLMLIAMIYPQKETKTIKYSILLILLASVSMHGYFISFILFIDFIISLFKKINLKQSLPVFLIGLNFVCTALYMKTPTDDSFPAGFVEIKNLFFAIINTTSNIFFNASLQETSTDVLSVILAIFTIFFVCKTIHTICMNKKQKILLYILNFAFIMLLCVFYNNDWHLGYEFLLVVFSLAVMSNVNGLQLNFEKNKLFYVCFSIIIFVQLFWSIKSSFIEKYFVFSPNQKVAEYIKTNHLEDKKIVGMNFNTISINPYFEKNMLSNSPKSYWYWKFGTYNNNINYKTKPILILDWSGFDELLRKNELDYVYQNYKSTNFHGALISKGRFKEDLSMTILIPKDN